MLSPLDNYHSLVAKVDSLCSGIQKALGDQLVCSAGCSSCCTAITLFPVEAAALREELDTLPAEQAAGIRRHVAEHANEERCPLLAHHRCLLYASRPVICRTHGLPILYRNGEERMIDCCPLNLSEAESLSGSTIIDLDRLNTLLAAVNSLYLSQQDIQDYPERLTIAEALTTVPPQP